MPKRDILQKLKDEAPDPKAFNKFKAFAKRIARVSKEEADEAARQEKSH